jgi:hypothetical protein
METGEMSVSSGGSGGEVSLGVVTKNLPVL